MSPKTPQRIEDGVGGVEWAERRVKREQYSIRETGFLRWQEAEEILKNWTTLGNMSPSKKGNDVRANKRGAGTTGLKDTGSGTFISLPPTPNGTTGRTAQLDVDLRLDSIRTTLYSKASQKSTSQ